jgi:hypothetical protein
MVYDIKCVGTMWSTEKKKKKKKSFPYLCSNILEINAWLGVIGSMIKIFISNIS